MLNDLEDANNSGTFETVLGGTLYNYLLYLNANLLVIKK